MSPDARLNCDFSLKGTPRKIICYIVRLERILNQKNSVSNITLLFIFVIFSQNT